ncbi:hypothetical protein niasHT_029389 [Heterodera trifolii]|uniref:Uncharacterized protein n=1 Tax=Heterodera trifolii TaxID=157864 RepID=A0ABD2JA12_9BILA
MINENAIISAAAAAVGGADQQHHASSSSSAACLPPAPPNDGELKQRHVPPAAASCSAPVCGHAMFGNPCAVGVVVGLLGLGVLLVAALSPPTAPPTAPIGPTAATVRYAARGGGGTPFRQPSQFAPAGAAGGELPPPATVAGRFVGTDQQQQQQQIDALRARLDQLQYELLGQVQYATGVAAGAEPWPPAFFTVDYNNHPKSLLARRHMAWQPMRRDIIENDEQQHGSVSPRHISWQPMKRQQQTEYGITGMYGRGEGDGGGAQKEQVMRTVEQQLVEVLKAGDRLGVSADEILAHLRAQNGNGGGGGGGNGRR